MATRQRRESEAKRKKGPRIDERSGSGLLKNEAEQRRSTAPDVASGTGATSGPASRSYERPDRAAPQESDEFASQTRGPTAPAQRSAWVDRFAKSARFIWGVLKQTFAEWNEDKVPRLGAALAYYSVFSLAPLLLIVIAVSGLVFGQAVAQGKIIEELQSLIGPDAAESVNKLLEDASKPTDGLIASFIGIALLLVGATGVVGQLQDALNTIWEVAPKPGRGLIGLIQDRIVSLALVGATAFLLLVSLVVSAVLAAIGDLWGQYYGQIIGQILNALLSFVVTTVLFAMIYKILPDARIGWNDVWLGAAITSLLFTIGKQLIGLYIGHSHVASVFGAAGSFVVVLIWVYYSSQLLLLGAEFTQVYANRFGSRILPTENAVSLTPQARAHQGMPLQADIDAICAEKMS